MNHKKKLSKLRKQSKLVKFNNHFNLTARRLKTKSAIAIVKGIHCINLGVRKTVSSTLRATKALLGFNKAMNRVLAKCPDLLNEQIETQEKE